MSAGVADLAYPSDLPVCAHRAEILAALRAYPVVIVCGDTGSGKTTQLPKMALEAGGGVRHRRIACTQPRRLAAVTMAERVACELKAELGGIVGYRHRFGCKISAATRIEFMTDGLLLAEARFDPLLRAYDTIIVDEAHERSLNVDFLLGILKRILERRRDLRVIVSSATLDVERFSRFFNDAPVIAVPGRLFPIEIAYRAPTGEDEADLPHQVAAALHDVPNRDDVLVFLPGERDIRETGELLRSLRPEDDVIPLLASLPAGEQRRAFQTSSRRRIVLATNVAETSVTIPGIRAVIDSGLARISRYVHRTQIQRLQIEPVSQASAKQRTGRCGRVGPGTCIRLYSKEDFESREAFTPPEIVRSSLAGVILSMLDLRLGDIERFPFIDPPRPAMIHEGLKELLELGAICHRTDADGARALALTPTGRKLAKIPVEPRLAKILLVASHNATLPSALPIVAAMASEDPRRRPIEEKAQADQAHARFRVAGSDFSGTLKLWRWWEDETGDLSQAKARKLAKANYLAFPKMREWRDLTQQLERLAQRLGLDTVNDHGGDELLHRSLLAGLLGRIGKYDPEAREYRGAHGLRFALHPASVVARPPKRDRAHAQPPEWVMAGELVDTARLFARNVATIDVRWLESAAGDICRHSYHSPEWDPTSGFVRATEQVTLYGLVIVSARRCDYSRIDPVFAREIFIRRGILDGEFPQPPPTLRANLKLLADLRNRAERARHPEIFDESRLFEHFQRTIPATICSANALRKWLKTASRNDIDAFTLKRAEWWPKATVCDRDFPETLHIANARLRLSYRNTPDDPERDGITCSIAKSDAAVLRLWHHDWLVPGLLPEKLLWMLDTLPSAIRRALAPLDEKLTILRSLLKPGETTLENAVRSAVYDRWGIRIPDTAWKGMRMPAHLRMRFRIYDDRTGKTLAVSRDLDELFGPLGIPTDNALPTLSPVSTTWTFGDIAPVVSDTNAGWVTHSYLALHDDGEGVSLRRYVDAERATETHAAGVARLFLLACAASHRVTFRRSRIPFDAALYLKSVEYADGAISSDLVEGALREVLVRDRPPVYSESEFKRRLNEDPSAIVKTISEMNALLIDSAALATQVDGKLKDPRLPDETIDSVTVQLAWLLYPGFLKTVPVSRLRHYRRYLKGALLRLERARVNGNGDLQKEIRFSEFWERYREAAKPENVAKTHVAELGKLRWMLEEYRISLFAQELRTPEPISPQRLEKQWAKALS